MRGVGWSLNRFPFALSCAVAVASVLTYASTKADDTIPTMAQGIVHPEVNRMAFSLPMSGLDAPSHRAFGLGNRTFNLVWAVAPSSVVDADGLGPTFVQRSCSACHVRDGRGQMPESGEAVTQAVIVLTPKESTNETWLTRRFGNRLQSNAVPAVEPEATPRVMWVGDDDEPELRRPVIHLEAPKFKGAADRVLAEPLVAPSVFGLGLLESISVEEIAVRHDPDDRDQDGVSGRLAWQDKAQTKLGRFGWKAGAASLRDQIHAAAIDDMGLTSEAFPEEGCPELQQDCRKAEFGDEPDLSDRLVVAMEEYLRLLAVPSARTAGNDSAQRGRGLFMTIGCESCHRERMTIATQAAHPVLENQLVVAYTDLLLHDMGEGLASKHATDNAAGNEWRTPPLWGLGLQQEVNGHLQLLHDGRARGFEEAILWHGGEAQRSRQAFEALSPDQRQAVLDFLASL